VVGRPGLRADDVRTAKLAVRTAGGDQAEKPAGIAP
jgi:hypothetical protein